MLNRRDILLTAAATGSVAALALPARAQTATAICYNCPPEWADWGGMLRLIGQRLDIRVPPDNKNSGQALAALVAERARPVADVVYLGGQVGPQARAAGVIEPYRPVRWEEIAAPLKDAQGYWFTIHIGTLGLFVNTQALRGRPVPRSWQDLQNPVYRGMVGYLNPGSAAVGQLGVMAVNLALGGSFENLDPGINFFRQLMANNPIVPTMTAYARVLSGEIPILIDFDFNAYRAKYTDQAPAVFVIPQEGTLQLPYVMALVRNGPNPAQGRRMLDFVLSEEGQRHWANAFMRPVFPGAMPAEVQRRFLPAAEYQRARPVDVLRLAAVARQIAERYQREVG
ncbi:extracellular solute-binding protein [Hydrogenophaga sp.]|uniref:extracellular solute-binding protein n=1 Tax=Hydrogenophaga sp. TaxID=1904254 RepID=UPI00198DF492|nr:extracellular solute-binding protein [Hydrogenophaga sp.]MBD3893852.1 extracellular solute-binding protein [Hydrogenophaga sp.]